MDVQKILENKIKQLPSGVHHDGLRAVKSHIESAVRHLARGQRDSDETLFTDAIYRCNQAFEGSTKEAYRVLAGKDPQKKMPAEIENFLTARVCTPVHMFTNPATCHSTRAGILQGQQP
jgi:hypothetical protein